MNMKKSIIAALVMAGLAAQGAQAASMLPGDAAKGKKLVETGCASCHGPEVYTRKDRKVKSVEGLMGQVGKCNANLARNYSNAQLNDVVKHLNDAYYKFE